MKDDDRVSCNMLNSYILTNTCVYVFPSNQTSSYPPKRHQHRQKLNLILNLKWASVMSNADNK